MMKAKKSSDNEKRILVQELIIQISFDAHIQILIFLATLDLRWPEHSFSLHGF